jgi:aconitate decarboxylase
MTRAENLPTDPSGPTGQLATWLANMTLDDVPAAVRERAKHLTLDGVGCALIGAQMPWSRRAVDIVTRLEGSGTGTLIGCGLSSTRPAAALLNGTFIQGFELDDFHPFAPLHSAALVLPSLLACAEGLRHVSGARFLKGVIAGFEVGPRVGLALHGAQMLSRGWHSGSVFGTHASAAAAGSLLNLDAAGFEDALGLAGTQSAGLMAAQFEAMSKRMHHGMASRNGLYAAVLAQGGYTGIKRVFEREYGGFLSTFGEGHAPDASQISNGLGQRWETERITVKAYAAMGGLHAAIDAVLQLDAERALVAEEIERIDVDLAHAVFHHGGWQATRPLTPIGAQMNLAYTVAVASIDRAAGIAQYSPDRINLDDVWSLIPRIIARHEEAFDREGALNRGKTRVRILFRDGQSLEKTLQAGRGILPPLTNSQIVDKYRTLTNGILDRRRQALIEESVLGFEELADVNDLVSLLGPRVDAAWQGGDR